MTAARDNSGKPRLSDLFHFGIALDRLVSHMNKGRAKYPDVDGAPNFLIGGKPDQEYLDCMMRHIRCVQQGEVVDSEGFDHLSAIAWNALAMGVCNYPLTPPVLQPINVDQTRPAFDDRT